MLLLIFVEFLYLYLVAIAEWVFGDISLDGNIWDTRKTTET